MKAVGTSRDRGLREIRTLLGQFRIRHNSDPKDKADALLSLARAMRGTQVILGYDTQVENLFIQTTNNGITRSELLRSLIYTVDGDGSVNTRD